MTTMNRSRTLYIVELENGNWHTIVRDKHEAEAACRQWNLDFGGAVVITVEVPEAKRTG